VSPRAEHERILASFGCALFRDRLLGHSSTSFLSRRRLPADVMMQHVYLSFEAEAVTVDNHEDGNGIGTNSLGEATSQHAGLSADEFPFAQGAGAFNGSFYGESTGMVILPGRPGGFFRSPLEQPRSLERHEIWIRAAEVTDGVSVPAGRSGFELGLEDANGTRSWVDTDAVGGLPRPYPSASGTIKTMLSTLRFKADCFRSQQREFDIGRVAAILIRANRADERAIALDDLQIVNS
jgi:hypothetical protein